MTERSESERAELVAIAGQIDIFIKYGTNAIFEPDDAKKIASALRRLAAQDQKPVADNMPDHGGADAGVPPAVLTYTNYRGETSVRSIVPKSIRYGSTEWHPEPQWLLLAHDTEKQADREFALKDFGAKPAPAAANASAENYRDAIDEALVTRFIGVAKGDAKAELNQIIKWEVAVALDPRVSSSAQALIDSGRNASAEARLRDALESCKVEQLKFEEWATGEKYEMHEHPLHYLFLNEKTYTARQGWKAALRYVQSVLSAHPHASDCDKQGTTTFIPVQDAEPANVAGRTGGAHPPTGATPSDRTADVTADRLADFIVNNGTDIGNHESRQIARAILSAFTVGRR